MLNPKSDSKILIVQTAFLGDVILTLPLIQVLKKYNPGYQIDIVLTPRASEVVLNHQNINRIIVYDKKGKEKGIKGFLNILSKIKRTGYDIALLPHRSFRSAFLAYLAKIPIRIGFDKSPAHFLYTHIIHYDASLHEVKRNLSFCEVFGIKERDIVPPRLYPDDKAVQKINQLLQDKNISNSAFVIIAPGSIWNTKRWLKERYAELIGLLGKQGINVFLIGGDEDKDLCSFILRESESLLAHSVAGKLSILESTELISRSNLLITNDSAPLHLATAMNTPIVAIFGPTVPEFGFGPIGENDKVVQIEGLQCRPCAIHGGNKCPIKTFDCMKNISAKMVFDEAMDYLPIALP